MSSLWLGALCREVDIIGRWGLFGAYVRIDLRQPYYERDDLRRDEIYGLARNGNNLIRRFLDSLGQQIEAVNRRVKKTGKRVHRNTTRYIWCRERCDSYNDHYHVVLLFSNDRFRSLGKWSEMDSLHSIIVQAWARALHEPRLNMLGLVNFSEYGTYSLNKHSPCFERDFIRLFYRLSYLAKKETKHYGEGSRCFGYSYR
jgi:hypothetical protein